MTKPVRYGDAFDRRASFLNEARIRFPEDHLTGILWFCATCGASLPLADILIDDDLKPSCPEDGCLASGWDRIGPATHLYD
jgi:hypothetical protein